MRGISITKYKWGKAGRSEVQVELDLPQEIVQFIESLAAATNQREEDILAGWIESQAEAVTTAFPDPVAKALKQYLELEEP